jgi:hypothetical protein
MTESETEKTEDKRNEAIELLGVFVNNEPTSDAEDAAGSECEK